MLIKPLMRWTKNELGQRIIVPNVREYCSLLPINYLHDSIKCFSHGCIEIEQKFFKDLRAFLKTTKKKSIKLKIKYTPGVATNGGMKWQHYFVPKFVSILLT